MKLLRINLIEGAPMGVYTEIGFTFL